jgi:hypothetical protein
MLYDIDWDLIISKLLLEEGDVKVPGKQFYLNTDGRFDETIKIWTDAGYDKSEAVEWINYYPGKHFDKAIVDMFSQLVNCKCARSWISRIRPGKMAPYHQDIDDNIEEYQALGELVRYSVFISKPAPGSIFLFKDNVYYLQPQGTVTEWDHYLDWHAGTNCGFTDKFMFHFLGIKYVK